jgi:hypothetical protein
MVSPTINKQKLKMENTRSSLAYVSEAAGLNQSCEI